MSAQKMYILDTNVLIHDPEALLSFSEALVGIPITVIEELDKFKTENSQRGRSARDVIRSLDLLRSQGSLATGVKLENGGTVRVLLETRVGDCPLRFENDSPDNHILNSALCMQQNGYDIVFISKDINMRVKADVVGIKSLDYLKDIIAADQFYKGWLTFQVPAVQLKDPIPKDLLALANEYAFSHNEYVLVESNHNEYNYKLFRYIGNKQFKYITPPDFKWPIQPRNPQQLIALDLLLDDSIQFVTLMGPAGTGKTFLALVAGLHKLLIEQVYAKILISRPVIPLGPDIGFLPGAIQDKLHSWMQPVYDNMDFIVHLARAGEREHISVAEDASEWHAEDNGQQHPSKYRDRQNARNGDKEGRDKYKKFKKPQQSHGFPTLDELVRQAKISLEAITYMRGRSIPYQYIFIDEVQNLTPHEVKTIVSRVGEGSKIIMAGDPYQIDSPYLDFASNGLMVASQKFKGQEIFGTAFLETSERSELSKLAGKLL